MALAKRHPQTGTGQLADAPLDYTDQRRNLNPQLRTLDLKLGIETAAQFLTEPAHALLVGSALAFMFRRRYAALALGAAGVFLQRAKGRRAGSPELAERKERERLEMKFQRYAIKAQRGDYGKLEIIPFR